jgi:hypothetical protein
MWQASESAFPALYAATRKAPTPEEYVKAARAWFEALMGVDPDIQITYYRNPTPTETSVV